MHRFDDDKYAQDIINLSKVRSSFEVFIQDPLSQHEFFDGEIVKEVVDVVNLDEKDHVFKLYEEVLMKDNIVNMDDQEVEVNEGEACVEEVVEVNE